MFTRGVAASKQQSATARALVARHGSTFAEDAGITLRDKPSPLWRLLTLALLLSARISSDIAVAAARELSAAGFRTPRAMADSTWQQRVDALGRGHYRRHDERTATQLGAAAERVLDEWGGDLRRLHATAQGESPRDVARAVERLLQRFNGIGPTGAAIFCREAQAVWPDLVPHVDDVAASGAQRLGLPKDPKRLAGLVEAGDLPRLVAGGVRAARDASVAADVRRG